MCTPASLGWAYAGDSAGAMFVAWDTVAAATDDMRPVDPDHPPPPLVPPSPGLISRRARTLPQLIVPHVASRAPSMSSRCDAATWSTMTIPRTISSSAIDGAPQVELA